MLRDMHGRRGALDKEGSAVGRHLRAARRVRVPLGGLHDLLVDQVECGAQHDPLDHVLVALAKRLPHGTLLGSAAVDRHARARATAIARDGILLDSSELDTLRRDQVARVRKVKHGPEHRIRVGLGNLEEGLVISGHIGVGERQLVHRRVDASVRDGPAQVARCLAEHRARLGHRAGRAAEPARARRRDRLGYTQIALHRGRQQVRLTVVVRVDIRVAGSVIRSLQCMVGLAWLSA